MNSEDIAKLAGVSRGTVSRVLNNKPDVSDETREKIEKIIKEYGYTPDVSARKLAGKPVDVIGFFVSDFTLHVEDAVENSAKWWSFESPYFIKFMVAFLGATKKKGYKTLVEIVNTKEEFDKFETYFKSGSISGVVFMGFEENIYQIERLIQKGYPIALIDQKEKHDGRKNLIIANTDDEYGGYLATEYLIKKGHRKIAHIHGSKKIMSGRLRIEGYRRALREYGILENPKYLIDGQYNEELTYIMTRQFLQDSRDDLPTAIFFANDVMAVAGIKAIKEAGFKIGDDISIIGYDNYQFGDSFDVRFTSVRVPLEKLASFATENIIKSINGEEHNVQLKVKVEIVDRGSVKELE